MMIKNVLDKGYVRLVDHMGSDLTIVNSARVSYNKESKELSERDIRLIKFLAREGHCYDSETEVLTDRGFIKWTEVTENDLLGVVDPVTGMFKGFEKPIDMVVEEIDDQLIHFETADIDLMVTKGHSLYCSLSNSQEKRRSPVFELHVADKIIESSNGVRPKPVYQKPMRMKKATNGNLQTGLTDNPRLFALYGFFIGDGSVVSNNSIQFHLKKKRKIDYLKQIANELGYNLKENKNDNYIITEEGLGYKFKNMFYNNANEKTFPNSFFKINQEEARYFFEGLKNSDGSLKRSTWHYDTTSEELANKLQALAAINGIVMSKNYNGNIIRLNVNSRRIHPRLNDNKNNKSKLVNYKGKVYCATVSTGLLIVRRNNKVVLCGNTSPFRHAILQFEIYAPLMVARQWWKYRIGSTHLEQEDHDPLEAWNESSRRYITEEPTFYIPQTDEWRSAPENSKQGSGEPVSAVLGEYFTSALEQYIKMGESLYNEALQNGICAEQARLFLPAYGMYVRWYWTASLQAVAHFLNQRFAHDAQVEIQQYAKAIFELVEPLFPYSLKELVKIENNA